MKAARDFTELLVWQIADELRMEILKLTERLEIARRYKFRDQVDDAIDSVCRNIAEGFAADTHGQFASYLRISRRSLDELKDACRSAQQKKLVTLTDLVPVRRLMARLRHPLNSFIDYLERTAAQRNRPRRRSTSDQGDGFFYRIE